MTTSRPTHLLSALLALALASCRHAPPAAPPIVPQPTAKVVTPPVAVVAKPAMPSASLRISLAGAWNMQSQAVASQAGAVISSDTFTPSGWYAVTVPCTVMAGLIQNGEYGDVFVGKNLNKVDAQRFAAPWWYRREITIEGAGPRVWLRLHGINYRAEIWLNGKMIADANTVVGTYRDFDLDVSSAVRRHGGKNVLALKISKAVDRDLDITFADWAPAPPDRNMGLWQDLFLETTGPVLVTNPFVDTDLALPSLAGARLTVHADLRNVSGIPLSGELHATVTNKDGRTVAACNKAVDLPAGDPVTALIGVSDCPGLALWQPDVWWPWQFGAQPLYRLEVRFVAENQISGSASTRFGVRKVSSRLDRGHRLFTVNGKDILIVGAGYTPDLFQRRTLPDHPHWQEDQIRYVRDMNLNTIRLEGKLEDDAFYELCDRYGILVLAGWMCCSEWEKWKTWDETRWEIYSASLRSQLLRARTHPSMLAWLHGSDNPPDTAEAEWKILAVEAEAKWPNPVISNAGYDPGPASGPSGMKMPGPYTYVPPLYWFADTRNGGAFGFNTEVGPSPVPPVLETLEEFLPPDHRWPLDDHAQAHYADWAKRSVALFNTALERHFGAAVGLEDYSWKAQAQSYDTVRALFEAFNANKFNATGEIMWLLNSAWPSMYGHLYDYRLRTGGAYFGAKIGNHPLHALYRYDNQGIVVTNALAQAHPHLTVEADLYNLDGERKHHQSAALGVEGNANAHAFTLPRVDGLSKTHLLRLTVKEANAIVSTNSYWLSTEVDVLDTARAHLSDATTLGFLPLAKYADYRGLQSLPPAELQHTETTTDQGGEKLTAVTITNRSNGIAAMVRLKLRKEAGGAEVLPVLWDDNYFALLPHETRTINARYRAADLGRPAPAVEAQCFNNRRR